MRIRPLHPLAICGALLALSACAGGDLSDEGTAAPTYEQIFVSKNDVSRSAVNLQVQAITLQPGEGVDDALRRAGFEPGSLDQVVAEARRAGPGAPADPAVPEAAEPEAAEPEAAEPEAAEPEAAEPEAAEPEPAPAEPEPGPAEPEPAPAEPEPAPAEPAPAEPGDRCSDSCVYAQDGACDDGRPGAPFAVCAPGTDCTDCDGAAAAPAPAPEQAEDASPDEGGQVCVANGRDGVCGPAARCDGTPIAGFCPGPANIQCCVPGAAPAPAEPEAAEPEAQACHANGQDGTCRSTASCGGVSVPGLCRGPADIQCCVPQADAPPAGLPAEGQACLASGRPGVCEDVATCEGSAYPGHCAGDNSIKCCVPDALENKVAPIVYGAGVLVVRGVLYFASRSAAPVAGRAVVGVMRQSPGQAQVLMGASGAAIVAAGASHVDDPSQVLSGTAGAITEGWRQGLAQSEAGDVGDNAPAVPDTLPQTNLCRPEDGSRLDSCVLRKRAEQGNATLEGGEASCPSWRHRELASAKDAACNLPSSCQNPDREVRRAGEQWISGIDLSAGQQLILRNFCRTNRERLAQRDDCISARQQVIDECFPGELGNETHRCEICGQMAQRETCRTQKFIDMGCDTYLRALGL